MLNLWLTVSQSRSPVPTTAEIERFEYVAFDYIADNPGTVSSVFKSFIGVYFSDTGERTDT